VTGNGHGHCVAGTQQYSVTLGEITMGASHAQTVYHLSFEDIFIFARKIYPPSSQPGR
jgi:hypothetical protein